ncbi:hypothetical protein, partial [Streptomyces lunaelactis]|uniref:hypothetical protein n=1 Tax=Streptomyces lunaelactis TaxID=1535768 RepID=UPI0015846E4B
AYVYGAAPVVLGVEFDAEPLDGFGIGADAAGVRLPVGDEVPAVDGSEREVAGQGGGEGRQGGGCLLWIAWEIGQVEVSQLVNSRGVVEA